MVAVESIFKMCRVHDVATFGQVMVTNCFVLFVCLFVIFAAATPCGIFRVCCTNVDQTKTMQGLGYVLSGIGAGETCLSVLLSFPVLLTVFAGYVD